MGLCPMGEGGGGGVGVKREMSTYWVMHNWAMKSGTISALLTSVFTVLNKQIDLWYMWQDPHFVLAERLSSSLEVWETLFYPLYQPIFYWPVLTCNWGCSELMGKVNWRNEVGGWTVLPAAGVCKIKRNPKNLEGIKTGISKAKHLWGREG